MTMMNALCLGLAGLCPVERRLLVLHYEHDLSPGELAELYEMPTAKVDAPCNERGRSTTPA